MFRDKNKSSKDVIIFISNSRFLCVFSPINNKYCAITLFYNWTKKYSLVAQY